MIGTIQACITPQVLWEFFAVITDPKRIEKPLSTQDALQEIQSYWSSERLIKILPNEHTFMTVGMLVKRYNIIGQHVHDAHLIGTMLDNNVNVIYSGDETLQQNSNLKNLAKNITSNCSFFLGRKQKAMP